MIRLWSCLFPEHPAWRSARVAAETKLEVLDALAEGIPDLAGGGRIIVTFLGYEEERTAGILELLARDGSPAEIGADLRSERLRW